MTETCPACGKTYLAASAVGCPFCKNTDEKSADGDAGETPPSLAESWEMIDEGWEDVDDLPPGAEEEQQQEKTEQKPQEHADADNDPPQPEQPALDAGAESDAGVVAVARDEDLLRGSEGEPQLREPGLSAPEDAVVAPTESARQKRTRAKSKKKRTEPPPQKAPKKKQPRMTSSASDEPTKSKSKDEKQRPWLLPLIVAIIALIALALFFIARKEG